MLGFKRLALMALAIGGIALASTTSAFAASACMKKAGQGTATTEDGAKFQAMEAILQATDWGMWAAWMTSGKTPGYKVGKVKYRCKKGGVGVECIGQTTICKS